MVKEIRIYIEGGGDSKDSKAFLRQGFSAFFQDLISKARRKGIQWRIVTCGSRNAAFDAFRNSVAQNPSAFNVVLIDSEAPVQSTPWHHLQQRGEWDGNGLADEHCHLMVQTMEAWLIADIETLCTFYGADFYRQRIPGNPQVEGIPKDQLEPSLRAATRDTQKGEYHKIHHAYRLLEIINVGIIRGKAPHCDRLFTTLDNKIA